MISHNGDRTRSSYLQLNLHHAWSFVTLDTYSGNDTDQGEIEVRAHMLTGDGFIARGIAMDNF